MPINNVFTGVRRWSDGALVIVVFVASLIMLACGLLLFVEDTYTSYMGLQQYQAYFGLSLALWPMTYWAQSILPQIGQIVFFYIFFSNMRENWWSLVLALGLLAIDFYADLYHRTGGTASIDSLTEDRTLAGAAITLFYFTIGAELFISIGWGVAMTTMAPAIKGVKQLWSEQSFALGGGSPRR